MTMWRRIPVMVRAIVVGLVVGLVGTVSWAHLIAANTHHLPSVPWVSPGVFRWPDASAPRLSSGSPSERAAQKAAPVGTFRVVNAYPHDATAYTQGLIYREGFLFESTGLNGQSTLRRVKLETGEVVQRHRVDPAHFAEGLAEWNGRLVQLTWRSNIAFEYDLSSFAPLRTFRYAGEGWGLTRDRERFILSDGTAQLRFFHLDTFREVGRVTVTDGGVSVRDLNELEYVRGEVFANVWHTDRIARILPESGRVVGWIDLRGLMSTGYRLDSEAVLNGIAYDAENDRLFVTGKLWPRLFEIEVEPGK